MGTEKSTTTKDAADAKVREGKTGSLNVNEAKQLDKVYGGVNAYEGDERAYSHAEAVVTARHVMAAAAMLRQPPLVV